MQGTCSRYGLRHIVDGHIRCLVFFSGIRTGIHVTSPSWDVQNVAVRRSTVTVHLFVTCLKLIAVIIHENENSKNLSGCEYNSLQIVYIKWRMRWAAHVACMEARRDAYRILAWRRKEKRPLGRPRRRSEVNITTDLQEGGWRQVVDWNNLALRLRIRTSGRVFWMW
jgi:hypothetical protein